MEHVFMEKNLAAYSELDVHGLAAGVYLLNLKTSDGTSHSIKVVVE